MPGAAALTNPGPRGQIGADAGLPIGPAITGNNKAPSVMLQALLQGNTAQKTVRAGAALVLVLAMLYLALKVFDGTDTIDFKYIHLAGSLWLEGIDPYTAAFAEQGQIRFQGLNRPEYLFYPPHWWAIATASAQVSYETAGLLWRVLMAACMIGGCLVLHRTVYCIIGESRSWRTWAMLVFAGAMSATAIALSLGQTSCLLFLGVALYVHAIVTRSRRTMALALVLVMLKPNFGLALSLFLAPALFWWPSLIGGAVAVIVLSLPALLPHGVIEVVRGYLNALGQWEALPPNIAGSTTGLRNLVYQMSGATLPGTWFAMTAVFFALGLGGVTQLRGLAPSPQAQAITLGLLLSGLVLIIPLHTYDMMLLIPLIALAAALPRPGEVILLVLMLIVLRAKNLAQALGLTTPEETYFRGTGLISVIAFAIFLLWVTCALAARRRQPPVR